MGYNDGLHRWVTTMGYNDGLQRWVTTMGYNDGIAIEHFSQNTIFGKFVQPNTVFNPLFFFELKLFRKTTSNLLLIESYSI